MGKEMMRTKQRDEILKKVIDLLEKEYDADIRLIGSGEIMMPVVDENGDEFYFKFKATIPRGKRIIDEEGNGCYQPYNGYDAADEYKYVLEERESRHRASAEKKAAAEKEKQRKRDAKKVIKKLNTEGLQAMIHEPDADESHEYLPHEIAV